VTLAELAARLDCRLEGDGRVEIVGLAGLEEAKLGDLSFLASLKYAPLLGATRASAVIVDEGATGAPCPVLRSDRPYLAWARAVEILAPVPRPEPGVSPLASVASSAELGPDVSIGAFAVIGARARLGARTIVESHGVVGDDVVIGDDTTIRAHASIRARVEIGSRVIIHDAAVIGADGFGFAPRPDGSHHKIPQTGRLVIEDDVEIGAHSAVDRPAVGETRIGQGTKIDNLVQVAHGVRIGRNVLMAAQSGVAGSTVLGDGVIMAGQSGAVGHVHLGKGVRVSAKSAVTKDVEPGQHVAGVPAIDAAAWREATVLSRRLPELRRELLALHARLSALEQRLK
jgi:UDP-3-O-[3-hydroxymyristoyl] glucosamine N-acyltransferase